MARQYVLFFTIIFFIALTSSVLASGPAPSPTQKAESPDGADSKAPKSSASQVSPSPKASSESPSSEETPSASSTRSASPASSSSIEAPTSEESLGSPVEGPAVSPDVGADAPGSTESTAADAQTPPKSGATTIKLSSAFLVIVDVGVGVGVDVARIMHAPTLIRLKALRKALKGLLLRMAMAGFRSDYAYSDFDLIISWAFFASTTTEGRVMGLMAPSSSMTLNGAPTLTSMLTISPTKSPAPSPGSADTKPDEESNDDEPDEETLAPDADSPDAADQEDNAA
ncbi:cell wall protein TIR4-like [Amaranthus tricolor]|uniref:cell wall protein TIR4-like n=1 Tax=Amaranthus tricolor TaxID=29722 RepID=UPI00258FF270|nr:cell wall protein TIR4-like [Amaranthus tricolor]